MLNEAEKNIAWTRVWELSQVNKDLEPLFYKGLTMDERAALLGDFYDFLDYDPANKLRKQEAGAAVTNSVANAITPFSTAAPMKMRAGVMVGVCVGHSRSGDDGAESVTGETEWHYNREVGKYLTDALLARGVASVLIDSYGGSNYGAAMADVARQLKAAKATLALELHFNCADGTAKGFEYLYASSAGKKLAVRLSNVHGINGRVGSPSRGIKDASSDRGSGFLLKTSCPAVICEPFFGDNAEEWAYWTSNRKHLADIFAEGILDYLG